MADTVPELAVQAVSVGALAIVGCVGALAVVHRAWLRRALLRLEDPRSLAALRIVFGVGLMLGVLELVLDATWFFSDEGLFLAEGARAQFAGTSVAGYTEGLGWQGVAGLWHYLAAGTASTLHWWDAPGVVGVHAAALVLAALGLLVGWWTRACAWLALALLLTLLRRDNAMWGGEQVYLSVLFVLGLSRCGHAWSVDNVLRCRALRRRGLLSEPGGAGDGSGLAPGPAHPQGLAAVYRAVPAWPRVLLVVQLGVLYCANGLTKSGPPWEDGTATALALQSDPYTRFDTLPLLSLVGETGMHAGTWAARAWETLFPVVVVGLAIAWWRRERPPRPRGASWLWASLLVAVVATLALSGGLSAGTDRGHAAIMAVFGQTDGVHIRPLLVWIAVGTAVWIVRGQSPGRTWALRWLFGRRTWLSIGLLFHATLQTLLNLGGFPVATVALYLACFSGQEVAAAVARVCGGRVVAMEDLSLPQLHRDDAVLPGWVMLAAGASVLLAVVVVDLGATPAVIRWTLIAAGAGLIAAGQRAARRAGTGAEVWAYGPCGRLLAGTLCAAHVAAIVIVQMPRTAPTLVRARAAGGELVERWLRVTGTAQGWSMFAPRPPSRSGSLHIEVVDERGATFDLEAELHREEQLGGLQWWPDRRRKVDLNAMSARKGLVEHYARAVCRRWALDHGGEAPQRVTITMRSASIPMPWLHAWTGDRVERFVARATSKQLQSLDCAAAPHGQLPPAVRARHGFAAGPFVSLPLQADRWPAVRAAYGPLWPYDEWLAIAALALWLSRWRREDRLRHRGAVAARR